METESTTGKLTCALRGDVGKGVARKLRSKGLIPAVLYGGGKASVALSVDPAALQRALHEERKENTLLELHLEGDERPQTQTVMLKDYQIDPMRQVLMHADFIRIDRNDTVQIDVPLLTEGRAAGVKLGGLLHQVFRSLPIECVATAIPASLCIDITELNVGDALAIRDLTLPEGVRVRLPDQQTCVQVVAPRKVEEEETAAEGEEGEGEEGEAAEGEGSESATPASEG